MLALVPAIGDANTVVERIIWLHIVILIENVEINSMS